MPRMRSGPASHSSSTRTVSTPSTPILFCARSPSRVRPGDPGPIPVTLPGSSQNQAEIAAWNGKPYFAYLNLDVELGSLSKDLLSQWDPFRLRAIDGSYLDNTGGTSDTPQGDLQYIHCRGPVYLSVQLARAQAAVDSGASGIMLDSVFDPVASIVFNSAARAGSFDSVTMTAFAEFTFRARIVPRSCNRCSASPRPRTSICVLTFNPRAWPTHVEPEAVLRPSRGRVLPVPVATGAHVS